ncbi:DNA-binding transcriptional LysR family regulator [Roseovarius halotolerans]|uniref:HTH-type transcriptional regulator CynR n=1 Tax=Roseovarius halotolerans TaxID=505353 RepID=A0A1X6YAV2_9RHOB|nr:LysR family transcriptional regulator [Roseovarius halotolerans]RKT34996.1 DNA-binding transcriptional LysR family regulator [Roseovarius halotolerans]SLN15478.1 HTH-type transcriptional regulator CynR [Roseovarius halotolerans]
MLDKLEMFIAVARERHFGRAADSLGVTQPTLSAGIKQLEEQLGVQLIFRGSRFGGLTPEGQSALVWARRIVGDARQLKDEMRNTRHGLSGRVRIAAIPTALTWAARLSAIFNDQHPNVRFTILSRTSRDILTMLENFEADIGISYIDNEPMGRVSTEHLYHEEYMLVCSDRSSFASQKSVGWGELDGQKLCLLTPDMQNRRIINKNFMDAGIAPEAWIESNSIVALVSNVESGDWLTVLPADIARFLAGGKPLKIIPLSGAGRGHSVGLVAPYREPHTPVIDALLTQARRLPRWND